MKRNLWMIVIAIIAVLGILDSSYALMTYDHANAEGGTICDINDYLSCSIVYQSTYAKIFGYPVALLGIIGYSVLLILSLAYLYVKKHTSIIGKLIFGWASISLAYTTYLTYVEFVKINALCPLCLISAALVIATFIISYKLRLHKS